MSSRNLEKSAKPWQLSTRHSVSVARNAARPAGRDGIEPRGVAIPRGFSVSNIKYERAGGVPTRHTHKSDGLHTKHPLERTDTNRHKHKQTHSPRHTMG